MLVVVLGRFLIAGTVTAQVTPLGHPDSPPMPATNNTPGGAEFGFALTLTNSGFGVGGYLRDSLNTRWALLVEASVGPGKDEREVAFLNRFGQKSVPGKANYLLVIPAHVGVQRRIFREQIDDNFRPFLQASAGPTVAWEYPYFSDCNGNGLFEARVDCNNDGIQEATEGDKRLGAYRAFPDGRPLIGFGGGIAVGSYFGHGHRGARGFRIGYSFNYYLAGTSLLEVDIDHPRHYFGTPHVVVFFGRLF
jgi:hypothetical protein